MTEVTSYGFALFVLYVLLIIYVSLQLGRIVYYKHKIKSFQVGILLQCWVWAVLRAVFFLFTDSILQHAWLTLTIYWLPVNIQFAMFSLLVVYYAQLGHQHKTAMKAFNNKYIVVWGVTNSVLLLLSIVWISIGISIDEPSDPDWLSSVHGYFSGTVFFILVLVLARECFRVSQMMRQSTGAKMLAKISFPKIVTITFLLFILFTTRCVYDIMMATGKVTINVSNGTDAEAAFTFGAFFCWEIIPAILVLILFGYVKSTTLGVFYKKKPIFPVAASFQARSSMDSAAQPLLPKSIEGQKRYITDEEAASPQSPVHSPYSTGTGVVGNIPIFTV